MPNEGRHRRPGCRLARPRNEEKTTQWEQPRDDRSRSTDSEWMQEPDSQAHGRDIPWRAPLVPQQAASPALQARQPPR